MKFREALNDIEGLRLLATEIEILSPYGRAMLMDSELMTDRDSIDETLNQIEITARYIADPRNGENLNKITGRLAETRDISTTLRRLEAKDTLDEVELFEIKVLTKITEELARLTASTEFDEIECLKMPDLKEVDNLLDPEKTGSSYFYIYDAYSPQLAQKRKELKSLQNTAGYDEEASNRLTMECLLLEDEIKKTLSERLRPSAEKLKKALRATARLDLLLAKAKMASAMDLCRPVISDDSTEYRSLRYLPVEKTLRNAGKVFQPVDIRIREGVTMITGANMGGKSITLKSVALAQAMAQFGFFVAAAEASIRLVDGIEQSLGDPQSAEAGLSSFGAEILRLDDILAKALEGRRLLVLIDEPARTTNPEEGAAIVDSIIGLLNDTHSLTLLTTHYGNIRSECRRLKVKGLRDDKNLDKGVDQNSLKGLMDYSLVDADGNAVDHEALRIACLLGIDRRFALEIEKRLRL